MELEELKSAWKTTNSRLEEMQVRQLAMEKTIAQSRTRSASRHLMWQPIFELVVAAFTVLWSGNFLADNFAHVQVSPASAVPVGLLYAMGIFTIWLSIRQLITISSMDYANPIVETQGKIAMLRSLRVRSTQFVMLVSLPLWVIFPLVLGQAVLGYDFVKAVDRNWIVANVAFGAVASLVIVMLAKKFGEKSRFFQAFNDILAGTDITKAQRLLADLETFGRS